MTRAIDCSSNNGPIDWRDLYLNGYTVAFVKTTEGLTYEDKGWQDRVSKARGAGLEVGVYHFAHPDHGNSPEAEAEFFFTTAKGLSRYEQGWVLDIEAGSHDIGAWSYRFLRHLESFVRDEVGIYFSPGWWRGVAGAVNPDIARFFLWEADYGVAHPEIVWPWTGVRWWQYTVKGKAGHTYVGDLDIDMEGDMTPEQDTRLKKIESDLEWIKAALEANPPAGVPAYKATADELRQWERDMRAAGFPPKSS